jgi:hypothetical protein
LNRMTPTGHIDVMTDAEKRERMGTAEDDLAPTLADLRAYRKRDPDFKRAIAEFVEAETMATDDPAEGRVVRRPPTDAATLQTVKE